MDRQTDNFIFGQTDTWTDELTDRQTLGQMIDRRTRLGIYLNIFKGPRQRNKKQWCDTG